VALAHDWLVCLRGSELVLDRLARVFGPTEIYTLVCGGAALSEAISACTVVTSPLQRFPGAAGRLRRSYLPLMPWAVGRLTVAPCDVLVSSSSCVMKGLRPPPGARHVCYCHSPARYVWFPEPGSRRGLVGQAMRLYESRFKRWDRFTAAGVDLFVAPSRHVAARIGACFGRESVVVPPPVRREFFWGDLPLRREGFWLVTAALEPIKRVDLAVEAANRAARHLVVAGDGSLRRRLARMAGPTVELLGWQPPRSVRDLARRASVFIQPGIEDFGIAAAEAMACGCPVVALREGGALDLVDEASGAFMEEQSVDAIIDATRRVPRDALACRARAALFSEEAFDRAMRAAVASVGP
jgi:glycosyltransferase involved in cell wall biosynthesis